MSTSVRVFPTLDDLSLSFAEALMRDLKRVPAGQFYSIALSGGSTPLHLFRFLSENFSGKMHWEKLIIFWGDERCVDPESEESNFRMAYETLLKHVAIPDSNIFRIRGEEDPHFEARQYSDLVSTNIPEYNEIPQFDLMILGLGSDGHTASIFPDCIHLFDSLLFYDVTVKPDNRQKRITATGKLINNSGKVFFLVTGKEKAGIVSRIIEKKSGYEQYPASRVNPVSGQLVWMLDSSAALKLK